MDSNQDQEEQECKKICTDFGAKMKASQCKPNTAQYAYETHLIPKLKYWMPLTLFSRDQWKTILWPARSATLQKMGMALCFPKDALYGTQEFNGFKFEDPY